MKNTPKSYYLRIANDIEKVVGGEACERTLRTLRSAPDDISVEMAWFGLKHLVIPMARQENKDLYHMSMVYGMLAALTAYLQVEILAPQKQKAKETAERN